MKDLRPARRNSGTRTWARKTLGRLCAPFVLLISGIQLSACAALSEGSGGSKNAPPSDLQFATNPASYVIGKAITANKAVSQRSITQFKITPDLPVGLTMDPTTGDISGTPTTITSAATYNVQASNSYGSAFVGVVIAITDVAPTITYGGATTLSYTVGSAVSAITPTLGGGPTVACQSIPPLPAGLSLAPTTCVLSGTPTVAAPTATSYSIMPINSGGSASLPLTITVIDRPPSFSYSSMTFSLVRAVGVTGGNPISTGGVITSCTATPPLPAGLTISSNCTISGAASTPVGSSGYTISATNSGGTQSPIITLDVHDLVPAISYTPTAYSLTLNHAMSATPSNSGGYIASCSSAPPLPAGLSITASNCAISGAPTALSGSSVYTITATNSAGSSIASLTIGVNDVAPAISYPSAPFTFTHNSAITPTTVNNGGGTIVACSSSPSLPTGLSISATTCVISGTPSAASSAATYMITATNSGGTGSQAISIKVNPIAPNLTYSGAPYTWDKNITITTQTPTNSGDAPTNCTSSPALPSGISLSPTCVISGAPTAITATATYTITSSNAIGSSTTPISITVNDTPPSISYVGSPFTYTKGGAITAVNPISTGGTIVSCASSPTLPTGLSISSACVITGTPSAITAGANYTITATNAGGTGTAVINVTVNDVVPSISYSGSPLTYTRGTAITALTATNSGGTITGCSVSPTLPTGLSISSTCSITGTPTVVAPATSYTVTASNTGGSGAYSISIAVIDTLPVISYSGSPFTFPINTAITAQTPTNSGGTITSCSTTPSLPAGLSISNLCVISGTPTVVTTSTAYGVTATNSAGSASATIHIIVSDAAPSITFAGSPLTYLKGTAITTLTPTNSGGTVISCASSPTLPAGLTLSSTCAISGTPTAMSGATSYTITATNSGGTSAPAISITVNDALPTLSYTGSPFAYTKNAAITTLTPTTGGGAIVSCVSSPTLPTGLSISSVCVITGTPTAITASASYTVTATDSGGTGSATITMAVNDIAPSIAYAGSPLTYVKGTAITTLTPTNSGGTAISCASVPTLPAGLSLSTTCAISGTPTAVASTASYTVTATNSGGTSSATISITVNDTVAVLAYGGSPFMLTTGTALSTQTPANTGGTPTSCSSSPSLPSGLSLSAACVITGTPTAASSATSYSITATNSGGSSSASISVTVTSAVPVIAYAAAPFTWTKNVAISSQTPTNSGGAVNSCASSPMLPAGLSLSSTCVITGTPTAITGAATYTITATNANGTGSASANITINDAAPVLSYSGSPFTFSKSTAITAQTPTNSGGPATSCSSSPTLPTGLSLSAACVMSGTPSAVTAVASYTITGTNTGGSSAVSVTITVNDASPIFSYSGSPFAFTKSSAISSQTPTNTGGTITGCSVSPALPGGLNLSSACVISGTPSTVTASASYSITATNTGGSGAATINIVVNDVAPTISYAGSPFTYTLGTAITTLTPTLGGGTVTGCASSPALPAGLSLAPTTCVLTGTPTTPSGATSYTITATNSGGSAPATINIKVNNVAPAISYAGSPYTFSTGTALSSQTPTNTGGAITSCASSPVLPSGLSLSTSCVITGTPSVVSSSTSYTITATNGIGSSPGATISITVNDAAPAISFTPSSVVEVIRTAITTLTPANTGGTITSCSSSPTLPAGLSVSAACVITGTPTALSASTAYTLTATNTGGTSSATLNIQVKNQPQILFSGLTNTTAGQWNTVAPNSSDVWVATQDGVSLTIVTFNTTGALDSNNGSWGPTGSNIVYNSKQAQTGLANGSTSTAYDIWTSTNTGTGITHLTANTGTATYNSDDPPVVSPDGTKVAYASKAAINGATNGTASSSYNIFVMNMNGTGTPTALTLNNTTAGLDSKGPVWSPDGTMIYYTSKMALTGNFNTAANANTNIWRINLNGGGMVPLTSDNTAGLDSQSPAISSDGETVVYASKEKIVTTTPLSFNIWTMNKDGTAKTALTTNTATALDSISPKFSPDMGEITFQSKMKVAGVTASSSNIWKMDASGLNQVALTTNTTAGLDSFMPNYSPDNSRIAFYSKQKFNATTPLSTNIWVMKSDGTSQSAITQNTTAGFDTILGTFNIWYAP